MLIERFLFINSEEVNSYLIACQETRQAMIIDAGGFDERLLQLVNYNKLLVKHILITHAHSDHVDAIGKVFEAFPDIELFASEYSYGENVRHPVDGEDFNLGELNGRFHHIPGHTDDMLVLYLDGHIFTGDVLFAGSVGGTSNDENYLKQIEGIRSKLLAYPDDTIIHPGHGPNSTIGLEKSFDPFL